jgi:replicative DNA helicase
MADDAERPTWDKVLRRQVVRLRKDAARRASGERVLTHVPTGFEAIDGKYGGTRIGVITEVMAHTGDGKSSFLRQMAEGAARAGVGVLWWIGEDPEDATAERQLSVDTGIDTAQLGRLDVTSEELDRLQKAAELDAKWAQRILPVFEDADVDGLFEIIDGTTTIGGARLGLVLVDYIQLLGDSRTLEADLARLGKGLHVRSRERKFASAAGSQVSTDVLHRGRDRYYANKDVAGFTPGLGDSEWCKRFEKSSKAVWSIVRPDRWRREMGEDATDDFAELHVRKSNFGPTGWVRLGWDGQSCRFINE